MINKKQKFLSYSLEKNYSSFKKENCVFKFNRNVVCCNNNNNLNNSVT